MDELIESFIQMYYSDELQDEIRRTFSIADAFNHNDAYAGFIDIINDTGLVSTDDLHDRFLNEISKVQNYLLREHTIELIDEATVEQKNDVLTGLFLLQSREDYTGIIRLLESDASNEEKITGVLNDITGLDETLLLTLIKTFNPLMLAKLKQFIYIKEQNSESPNVDGLNEILANFKIFISLYGNECLGAQLVTNDMLLGAKLETYIPYIENDIVDKSDERTAKNILSICYMSSDAYLNPIVAYRNISLRLLHDLNTVSRIEILLINLISKFEEFKKALHEKDRLSSTSN